MAEPGPVPECRATTRLRRFDRASYATLGLDAGSRMCRAGFSIHYNRLMRVSRSSSLHAAISGALADVPCVSYAVVFESYARGTAHAGSDVDVALRECLSLATHWLADEGWEVLATYAEVFRVPAERDVLEHDLAARMAAAAGLRNLIAHRYGALDWTRVHDVASHHVQDLLRFCDVAAGVAIDGAEKS